MSLISKKCINCGAPLFLDGQNTTIICEFCGTPFVIEQEAEKTTTQNNTTSTVDNLLKRAKEFELQENYLTAVEYYERVLDIDFSNVIARDSIDKIKNSPILTIPITGSFFSASLILTRKNLTYQTRRKTKVYPIADILSVSRFVARLTIVIHDQIWPVEWAIGSAKNAKAMEQAIKKLLADRQFFK